MQREQKQIFPVERAKGLDNSFRKLLHNPQKILKPYIKEGMTVLDVGCGPGFFSVEIAKMLNDSGKVIAADVQEGMLEIIRKKIEETALEQRIVLHKSGYENIDIDEKLDLVIAFYMVHEVRNQKSFFEELISLLKPNGVIFIMEPKFEVKKSEFIEMVDRLKEYGFVTIKSPKVFLSWTVALTLKKV